MLCISCREQMDGSDLLYLKCGHTFCWKCITDYVEQNIKPKIKCPVQNCTMDLRDSHIRKVLDEDNIKKYEDMCIEILQQKHKCILQGCSVTVTYSDSNVQFQCPVCTIYNCIACKAAHKFSSCQDFQRMNELDKYNFCQMEVERATKILKEHNDIHLRNILLSLEELDLLTNDKAFICCCCLSFILKGDGVKLKTCFHQICRTCLVEYIPNNCIPVKCPEENCKNTITDQEIQSILDPDEWQQYLLRHEDFIKTKLTNGFQCRTPNCNFLYHFSTLPEKFICNKCKQTTCVSCKAVHQNESCLKYKLRLESDPTMKDLAEKIKAGELMICPDCETIIKRIDRCYGVICPNCQLSLCFITQQRRWGPKGPGDTSGGCKCRPKKKCHVKCQGCLPDYPSTQVNNTNLSSNNTSSNTQSSNDSWCSIL